MGPIGCPETSVRNYHYSLRNSPEEGSSQPLNGFYLNTHHCYSCTDSMCFIYIYIYMYVYIEHFILSHRRHVSFNCTYKRCSMRGMSALYSVFPIDCRGRDSSVGVATDWADRGRTPMGAKFSAPVHTGPGAPSLLYSGYRAFPGDKTAGAWR